jgi:hypothetical protein
MTTGFKQIIPRSYFWEAAKKRGKSGVREIALTQGKTALVDDEDYEHLSRSKWHARLHEGGIWYARRSAALARDDPQRTKERYQRVVLMHREVMNAPHGRKVDHINGNGLDNRRQNLRLVGDSENQQNRHSTSRNTSGYRGVTWNKRSGKWQAGIKRYGKSSHLGLHQTKEAAAQAYDDAARRIYGPDARTNFGQNHH